MSRKRKNENSEKSSTEGSRAEKTPKINEIFQDIKAFKGNKFKTK